MTGVDLGDLIDFLRDSFPIIPSTSSDDPKTALEQFYAEEIGSISVICDPVTEWAQGDIITSIPFTEFSDDGKLSHFIAPGMIVTSTCDLDRKENVVFCPCFSLEMFKPLSIYKEIPKNTVFEFFFIGHVSNGEQWVVDLSHPMTLPRKRVFQNLESGHISRLHSLTQVGWYLFITKFSLKYFRPDDPGTMKLR